VHFVLHFYLSFAPCVAAFPRFADARQRFAIIRDSAAATGGNAFVSGWLSVEDDVND
jgi:hypothetical protein